MKNLALTLLLFFVGIVGVFTFRPLGNNNVWLEQGLYLFASLLASSSAFLTLRAYGRGPRFASILCLAFGLLSWFVADSLFMYFEFIVNNLPYPSLADYFYLAAYILLFVGLMFEVKASDIVWRKMNKLVYALSGMFTVFMLGIFIYVAATFAYDPKAPLWETIVTLGYTVGDLLLVIAGFFILVVAWEYRGGKAAKVWISLFLGFLLTFGGDLFYAIDPTALQAHIGLIYSLSQYCYIGGYLFIVYGLLNLRAIFHSFQKRALK